MVNVGNGVDISSVSSNTHQTPGYDDGPDMLKNRNLRVVRKLHQSCQNYQHWWNCMDLQWYKSFRL